MAINVENYFEQKLKFDQITNPGKTLEQVKADFQKAGVSAEEHYKKWGWAELLSLDTDFDVAQYLADKAALDGKTVDQVIADFKKAGVNPQEHYENWGKGEGLTPVAVGATPGEGEEPGTPNTLTEKLAALQTAKNEYTETLADLELDTNADGEADIVDGSAGITDVESAKDSWEAAVDVVVGKGFAGVGKNAQNGLIADHRESLEASIAGKKATVTAKENAVGKDLLSAISTTEARAKAYENALNAQDEADLEELAERAKFDVKNDDIDTSTSNVLKLGTVAVAEFINNQWKLKTDAAAKAALDEAVGFDAYFQALQAKSSAKSAVDKAYENLEAAALEVIKIEKNDKNLAETDLPVNIFDIASDNKVTIDFAGDGSVPAGDKPAVPSVDDETTIAVPANFTVTLSSLAEDDVIGLDSYTQTVAASSSDAAQVAAFISGYNNLVNSEWIAEAVAGETTQIKFVLKEGKTATAIPSFTGSAASKIQPVGAFAPAIAEQQTITFSELKKGETVTVAGEDIVATADWTAADVASAVVAAFATSDDWSLTQGTDTPSNIVIFTSKHPGTDVEAIEVDTAGTEEVAADGVAAPNAQAVVAAREALKAAEKQLADFNELVANWQDSAQLLADVEALKEAVEVATEAITAKEEDGGLNITLLQDNDDFTAESDLYLFATDIGATYTLQDFAKEGVDQIYFGTVFDGGLVEITDAKGIKGNVGDVAKLEILWVQDNNNVILYVEDKSFAGNGSTDADVTTIILTGVNGEDLSFDNGFLTIAA